MKKKIIILGAGSLGLEVLGLLFANSQRKENDFEIIGFLDDMIQKGTKINGIEVIGDTNDIEFFLYADFVIAIGDPLIRKEKYDSIKNQKCSLPNIVHPNSSIEILNSVNWKNTEGNIIMNNVSISIGTKIGNNNLIGVGSILTPGLSIGNHNTIMQGVIFNDIVNVGDTNYFGPGTIIDNFPKLISNTTIVNGFVISNK
jgi:NDP-sugar pyrophosphorylase family protein